MNDDNKFINNNNIPGTINFHNSDGIIVAIDQKINSAYIINLAVKVAQKMGLKLYAVYVDLQKKISEAENRQLAYNLNIARSYNTEIIIITANDIVDGLLTAAKENNALYIVIGKSYGKINFRNILKRSIIKRLLRKSSQFNIHVVFQPTKQIKSKRAKLFFFIDLSKTWKKYSIAFLLTSFITFIGILVEPVIGYRSVALIYLVSIVLLSVMAGRGPMFLAAVLSTFIWDFIFIPPMLSCVPTHIEDAMMLGTYCLIALILGYMTSQLHNKEQALSRQEKRNSRIYDFSKILSQSNYINDIISNTIKYIDHVVHSKVALYFTDKSNELQSFPHELSTLGNLGIQNEAMRRSYMSQKIVNRSTDTITGKNLFYLPLVTPGTAIGIMVICPESDEMISFEVEDLLQNIAAQLSLRIEREHLLAENQSALLLAESERLYKIVLNSISHEIRTPLTAIAAASSSLLDEAVDILPNTRKELTYEISRASDRLNRIVENLLDISRLESGLLKLNKQYYDIEDLVSVVLRQLDHEMISHNVQVYIDLDLTMIEMDFALMEQMMTNLLLNAAMHTQPGSTINIRAVKKKNKVLIKVADDGPGIQEGEIPVLFEKFRKGVKTSTGGIGLGLSICRGIAEAHAGSISVRNIPAGGAEFIITLPLNGKEAQNLW